MEMIERDIASETTVPAFQGSTAEAAAPIQLSASTIYPPDDRIRQIIREELALALQDVPAGTGNADTTLAQPLQSGTDYGIQRDAVSQSIDYYVSVGRITEQEMSRLQLDIARLNPDDRRAMMGAIVKAMNTGQLNGRL